MLNDMISTILKDTYMISNKIESKPSSSAFDIDDEDTNQHVDRVQPIIVVNVFNVNAIGGDV